MVRWLLLFLGLCPHKWEVFHRVNLTSPKGYHLSMTYHCKCTLCGKIKAVKIKA